MHRNCDICPVTAKLLAPATLCLSLLGMQVLLCQPAVLLSNLITCGKHYCHAELEAPMAQGKRSFHDIESLVFVPGQATAVAYLVL